MPYFKDCSFTDTVLKARDSMLADFIAPVPIPELTE